jgi:hypothetical protein
MEAEGDLEMKSKKPWYVRPKAIKSLKFIILEELGKSVSGGNLERVIEICNAYLTRLRNNERNAEKMPIPREIENYLSQIKWLKNNQGELSYGAYLEINHILEKFNLAKVDILLRALKRNLGKLDFKKLNQELSIVIKKWASKGRPPEFEREAFLVDLACTYRIITEKKPGIPYTYINKEGVKKYGGPFFNLSYRILELLDRKAPHPPTLNSAIRKVLHQP